MAAPDRFVILITGTSRGLGRSLAEHYAGLGHAVEGCSRGGIDWGMNGYRHNAADVTDERQVCELLAGIRNRHGRLDVVINNAGVASMNHTMLMPASTFDHLIAVNLRGPFLTCRESAKLMSAHQYGRIINISSVAVPLRIAGEAVYAATKSALEQFTRILARELGDLGITCNAVGPGPIDTDLIRGIPRAKIDELVGRLAIKRRCRFEDVANVVDFFVNPASDYVTGQVVYLGGAG